MIAPKKPLFAVASALALLLAIDARPQDGGSPTDQRDSAQIFFTGHSLIDNPLPDWVELIAKSKGNKIAWEQQNIPGAPLRLRTWGGENDKPWAGYGYGKNRDGEGLNVADELRHARHIKTGRPYDTLVIAENHGVLGNVIWENAIGYLRHIHDRLMEGNPQGRTLYVHTWLAVDENKLPIWLEHEKNVSVAWQCVAEKVRLTLRSENRPANLSVVPGGTALIELVDQALQGKIPGIQGNTKEVLGQIFRDDVHLTDAGIYFMAAVHYAAIYHQSPEGAKAPATVSPALVADLQRIAWESVQDFLKREQRHSPSMEECRQVIVEKVCHTYWTLAREPDEVGRCRSYFAETRPQADGNPFIWPDPNWKPLPKPSL